MELQLVVGVRLPVRGSSALSSFSTVRRAVFNILRLIFLILAIIGNLTVSGFRFASVLRHEIKSSHRYRYPYRHRYRYKGHQTLYTRSTSAAFQAVPQTDSSMEASNSRKHLVLVGGGHAHLQVIKALNKAARPSNLDVTLIDMQDCASYSGMVPGCVSKLYQPSETQIQLRPLAEWAGISFLQETVNGIDFNSINSSSSSSTDNNDDTPQYCIQLANGKRVHFDAISFDIGSTTRGLEVEGVSELTIPTRPISNLVETIQREEIKLLELQQKKKKEEELEMDPEIHVVVIGGGAAGIELALAIKARWTPISKSMRVTLLNSGTELLSGEAQKCKDALMDVMQVRNIEVKHDSTVQKISSDCIHLINGENISYTHCIWATGAASHSLAFEMGKQGLALNERGWIRVNPSLQSISHPCVFAAGDCATIDNLTDENNRPKLSPPKAGVYAVRSGPILIENLSKFLFEGNAELTQYNPQDDFLKLLMCGDGTALGFRFGIPLQGKWVWKLKDHIDVMFMDLFRAEHLPVIKDNAQDDKEGGEYDTSQYDSLKQRPTPMSPDDAAIYLRRSDDDVDFQKAWNVLRDMMDDDEYKNEVLRQLEKTTCRSICSVQ